MHFYFRPLESGTQRLEEALPFMVPSWENETYQGGLNNLWSTAAGPLALGGEDKSGVPLMAARITEIPGIKQLLSFHIFIEPDAVEPMLSPNFMSSVCL